MGKALEYDLSSLTNSDIVIRFTISARNKFDTLRGISKRRTPNDDCVIFLTTRIGVTA